MRRSSLVPVDLLRISESVTAGLATSRHLQSVGIWKVLEYCETFEVVMQAKVESLPMAELRMYCGMLSQMEHPKTSVRLEPRSTG